MAAQNTLRATEEWLIHTDRRESAESEKETLRERKEANVRLFSEGEFGIPSPSAFGSSSRESCIAAG